jgi:hypothetical protein
MTRHRPKTHVKRRVRTKGGQPQSGGAIGVGDTVAQALTFPAVKKAVEKFILLVLVKYGLSRALKAWEDGNSQKVNPWLKRFLQWVPNIYFTVAMVYPTAFQNPVVGAIAASFFRYVDDWLAKKEANAATGGMATEFQITHLPHAESVTQAVAAPPPPRVSPEAMVVPPPLPAVVSEVATVVKRRMGKVRDVVEKGAKGTVWVAKGAAYVAKEIHDDAFTDRERKRGGTRNRSRGSRWV